MIISLIDVGKKYNKVWVFRKVNEEISKGEKLAIVGHNGSGKSTLLKTIGGYVAPTEGKIDRSMGRAQPDFQVHFAIAAPYLKLIEEYTLIEHLNFHAFFKKPLLSNEGIIKECNLQDAAHKPVAEFSSGMQQRLRLALAFFYESEVILLDEPSSNLDQQGVDWYLNLVEKYSHDRTLIIASNQKQEYEMCSKIFDIENFKKKT